MTNKNNPFTSISSDSNYPDGSYHVRTRAFWVTVSRLTNGRIHIRADRGDVYSGPEYRDTWKEAFSDIRAEVAEQLKIGREISRENQMRRARERAEEKAAEAARRAAMTAEERAAEDATNLAWFESFFGSAA